MQFHVLEIEKPTRNAISKLRKGQPVRISAGSGFPIVVHSERLKDIATKFDRGARHTLAMTADELNRNYHHLSGEGIFGKKFDQALEKNGVKHLAYHLGDMAKPIIKGGIDTLAGAASLAQPELAPLAMGAAYMANDFLDNPNSYMHDDIKQQAKSQAENYLNDQFNTNYGNAQTAAMNALAANSIQSQINAQNGLVASSQFMAPLVTAGLNGPQSLQSIASVPSVMNLANVAHTANVRSRGHGLYVSGSMHGDGLYAGMSGGAITDQLLASNRKKFPGQSLPAKRHGKIHDKNGADSPHTLLYNTQATTSQPYLEFYNQSSFLPASVRRFRNTATDSAV